MNPNQHAEAMEPTPNGTDCASTCLESQNRQKQSTVGPDQKMAASGLAGERESMGMAGGHFLRWWERSMGVRVT